MCRICTKQLKSGIFNGPAVRHLINDLERFHSFVDSKSLGIMIPSTPFVLVVKHFLDNNKFQKYTYLLKNTLINFKDFHFNIIIKVYYLHSQLDTFPVHLGDMSERQDQKFNQGIKKMET